MSKAAERTHPELWEEVKAEVRESDKGGKAGEWSARKAQLAVQEYKKRGGGYRGREARETPKAKKYREASPKKREDSRKDEEVARRPQAIMVETSPFRDSRGPMTDSAPTRADLMRQARMLEIDGYSRMNKDALARAIRYAKH